MKIHVSKQNYCAYKSSIQIYVYKYLVGLYVVYKSYEWYAVVSPFGRIFLYWMNYVFVVYTNMKHIP